MKKSAKITLSVLAAVGLASCGRSRRDPCDSSYFDQMACQDAVRSGGYYYGGSWVHMGYSHPYPYYYDSYSHYVSRGGRVTPAAPNTYARPAGAPAAGATATGSSTSGTTRGGFGATGSGSSSGSSGSAGA